VLTPKFLVLFTLGGSAVVIQTLAQPTSCSRCKMAEPEVVVKCIALLRRVYLLLSYYKFIH
jgi:hypothetical protein